MGRPPMWVSTSAIVSAPEPPAGEPPRVLAYFVVEEVDELFA